MTGFSSFESRKRRIARLLEWQKTRIIFRSWDLHTRSSWSWQCWRFWKSLVASMAWGYWPLQVKNDQRKDFWGFKLRNGHQSPPFSFLELGTGRTSFAPAFYSLLIQENSILKPKKYYHALCPRPYAWGHPPRYVVLSCFYFLFFLLFFIIIIIIFLTSF